MQTVADQIIDALEGTTAVARLIDTPTSTVHSWRKKGIPPARFSHLKLAAAAAGKQVDLDAIAAGGVHNDGHTAVSIARSPGKADDISAEAVRA